MWNEEPRETELAFKVADRIISIQECEEGYDYSIMDENYREIDGGVYDNPDVDIRYALLDIVDDLATHPDTNGAKGNISSDAKWVQLDFDEVSEQMDIANLTGPEVFMSRVVMEFKANTKEFMPNVEKYLEEKAMQMGKKLSVTADLQSKKMQVAGEKKKETKRDCKKSETVI